MRIWYAQNFVGTVIAVHTCVFTQIYLWHHLESPDLAVVNIIQAGIAVATLNFLRDPAFRARLTSRPWMLCLAACLVDNATELMLLVHPLTKLICDTLSAATMSQIWAIHRMSQVNRFFTDPEERTSYEATTELFKFAGIAIGGILGLTVPLEIVTAVMLNLCLLTGVYVVMTWTFVAIDRRLAAEGGGSA